MTRPKRIDSLIFVCALTGAGLLAGMQPARAQLFGPGGGGAAAGGNIEGFTVTGKGSVAARPNRMEIELEVSAASELTADAIVKYRDAKRRLQDAFSALKLGNVTVEERGLLVDQKGNQSSRYFFDYTPNRRNKAEVQLTRKLVVKCTDIRKLDEDALLQLAAKLLDVAQDAGGKVLGGQQDFDYYYYYGRSNRNNSLVRFILDDFDKLEDEAYRKAIADAEARAQRLAKLSRVKLGPVRAVRETLTPGEAERDEWQGQSQNQDDSHPKKQIESSRYQEIPVKVELVVRFDIAGASEGTGRSTP